ncbi:type VI secretion system contractile sheath large subunit [uncultured Roseobacter sp.]|uniref:type VI secretion system contractile sheath large subunit n=1 Tax=uncultured Roseobacter sp. TaxID=114847 RepID=UPI002626A16F|nr:type VI secretion system contractile sheath large subunit [uncultured Roseobacter sp.]
MQHSADTLSRPTAAGTDAHVPVPDDADRHRAVFAQIDRVIAIIDAAITRQAEQILRHAAFVQLEARWRGLALLVSRTGPDETVRVRLLNASWPVVARDLERAADFDQSHLHKLVYDNEFGMPGGLPFGLLLCDYTLSHRAKTGSADPVEAARRLASVAAASFCPAIARAGREILGLSDRDDAVVDLPDARMIARDDPAYSRWQTLRQEEDTRFLGLVAPDLLLPRPTDYTVPRGFTISPSGSDPIRLNGAFGLAVAVVDAYRESGWFAAIRGAYQDAKGGGRVGGLQPVDFHSDRHGLSAQTPVSRRLTGPQEEMMVQLGVVPLSTLYMDADPVFNTLPSVHAPRVYDTSIATQNARLAAMLHYMLCTSRFAHYLKVMMRDEVGTIADPSVLEHRLDSWLRGYCLGNDDAGDELKAQYPLRDAGVRVQPLPGRPGCFGCTIRLQPHFQLDDVSTSFHLVAETSKNLRNPSR